MVTLTRRVNESFLINEEIRVTVVHLRDQRVRIQVDAPEHVSIRREQFDGGDREPARFKPTDAATS